MTEAQTTSAARYHCNACGSDLTDEIRIKCAECTNFDLCLQCFGEGAEPAGFTHKSSHDYQVQEVLDFPIFVSDWAADEELLLVEAAEKLGLGNWEAIAEQIGTKTRDECESHYHQVYLNSPHWPAPNMDVHFDKFESRKALRELAAEKANQPTKKPVIKPTKPLSSGPTNHEVGGFMPGRGEFDTEPENEADHLVKDMDYVDPVDPDEDFKLLIAEMYNDRLDVRKEKKDFVFERGLVDFRRINTQEKRRGKEEKDAISKLRVFSRVMTKEDCNLLETAITAELQTRARIAQLQEWRKMGLTTLNAGILYEREKQHRLAQRLMGTAAALQPPVLNPMASNIGNLQWTNLQGGNPHAKEKTLDISTLPGSHLLTQPEQSLCSSLRIEPNRYLWVKNLMITDCMQKNGLKKKDARTMVKMDVNKIVKLYEFFTKAGWIWPPPEN